MYIKFIDLSSKPQAWQHLKIKLCHMESSCRLRVQFLNYETEQKVLFTHPYETFSEVVKAIHIMNLTFITAIIITVITWNYYLF